MSFHIRRTRITLHPLLPLLWLTAGLGGPKRLLAALAALLWHESGHLLASRLLGVAVAQMEITPLGAVITLEHPEALRRSRQFLLACMGPVFSFAGCFLAPWLFSRGAISFSFACAFAKDNLTLLVFNLLPVLPLDGGRMLAAVLSRFFPARRTARLLGYAAVAAGAALCAFSLYWAFRGRVILSPAFCGLYLIYAAAADGKRSAARYVTALIARRQRLENGAVLPVEAVAAGGRTPVEALLPRLTPGRYHVIYVLAPDGMKRLGVVEEQAFCEAALSRPGAPLAEIAAAKKSP